MRLDFAAFAALAAALALALSTGCGEPAARGEEKRLSIAAAASLRDLVEATSPAFASGSPGAKILFSFGASSTLARQISEGAAFDVFLSADSETVERVRTLAAPGTIRPFLSNRLAVVAREGLPAPPAGPGDLASFEGRLALAGPAVPAGKYARAYLAKKGLMEPLASRLVLADDVRAALALVESGAADLAIVYETDARIARRARRAFSVPAEDDPGIAYVACALGRSASPLGTAYLEFLRGEAFRAAAAERGFLVPSE